MKKKKLTRKQKEDRNKSGKESVNSKYSRKARLQARGTYSPRSPFFNGEVSE
jgi:hypothetical protein